MMAIALLFFIVNAIAAGWAFSMAGDAIKNSSDPTVYLLVTIGLVAGIAVLAQFIARLPEADAHVEHTGH